jgi:hypothetical protein
MKKMRKINSGFFPLLSVFSMDFQVAMIAFAPVLS